MSKSPPNMEPKSPKRSSIWPESVMAPSLWNWIERFWFFGAEVEDDMAWLLGTSTLG